jgi:hypothetical protein
MWRTFTTHCSDFKEFDEFLQEIEESGYMPVLLREQWEWQWINGRRVAKLFCAVTSRKVGS